MFENYKKNAERRQVFKSATKEVIRVIFFDIIDYWLEGEGEEREENSSATKKQLPGKFEYVPEYKSSKRSGDKISTNKKKTLENE